MRSDRIRNGLQVPVWQISAFATARLAIVQQAAWRMLDGSVTPSASAISAWDSPLAYGGLKVQ
jgi:hypothetical protein